MTVYPYYIVLSEKGRLQCPPHYRRTPMEKLFVSGKIGGKKVKEYVYTKPEEAQRQAFIEERDGCTVTVYKVENAGNHRAMCREWRRRNWSGT